MENNYADHAWDAATETDTSEIWIAVIGADGVIMQLYTTKMFAIEKIKEQPFF